MSTRRAVVVGLLVLSPLVIAPILWSATKPDAADVRAAVTATARELERTPVHGLGITSFDVEEAMAAANPGGGGKFGGRNVAAELRITSAGSDDRGDLYEITNSDGEHPVCLAVRLDVNLGSSSPSYPSTSVTDGRCVAG